MKTTPAYTCICQDCNKVFIIDEVMVTVINLDDDKDTAIDFFSSSLNKISCPYCNASFTYEIPMLIFSLKDNFAIKVAPHLPALINSPPNMLPDFFKAFSFRYRQVTYHIEALEKARIFKDGLDDRHIEYVKLSFFPDADATPMEDINLCYKSSDSEKLYFEKLDYNGKLIKEFEVLKSDIKKCSFCHATSHLLWHKINRYTIKNLIIKEEKSCLH